MDNSGILKPFKILILGLDNSGKTSILISLSRNTNILSFSSLKPTKGIDISSYESDELMINIWEFGGQEQYRDEHLKNFEEYITGANLVIYVIDIQDIERYEYSLEFLKSIVNNLKESNDKIELNLYFHKYDPNIHENKKFVDIDNKIKSNLIDIIFNFIPSTIDFKLFKTTIYTVFEKNLIPL